MKTVFSILPATGENEALHLLTEFSGDSISFLFFTKEPFRAEGLLVFEINKDLPTAENVTALETAIINEPLLNRSFSSTTILYNVKESTLVPKKYHNPMVKEEMLSLLFGNDKEASVFDENIREKDMVNVYRVSKTISSILRERFPFSSAYHSNTLLLPQLSSNGHTIHCIVYQHHIKVILQKQGQTAFVQQFSYQTATDIVYYLLNICTQHEIAPNEVQLLISGMIDEQSNLYSELYKYFLQIQFSQPSEGLTATGFEAYPSHFFQHLILLASCV